MNKFTTYKWSNYSIKEVKGGYALYDHSLEKQVALTTTKDKVLKMKEVYTALDQVANKLNLWK
jgi:hypothetical protein